MSSLDRIGEMLHQRYLSKNQQYLEEQNKNKKGQPFTQQHEISAQNIRYLLYQYDEQILPFFSDLSGLRKMPDYLLFAEETARPDFLYLFLIELKLGNQSALTQLKAGQTFAQYLIQTALRIQQLNDAQYVKIGMLRISQAKTNPTKRRIKPRIQFDEKCFCDYPFQTLHLPQLIQALVQSN